MEIWGRGVFKTLCGTQTSKWWAQQTFYGFYLVQILGIPRCGGFSMCGIKRWSHCLNLITVSFNWSTQLWCHQQEISARKLHKPLQSRSTSHGTVSIDCTSLSLCLSCVFYLSWNNKKHNMLKNIGFFFHLQYQNGYSKIHQL